MDWSPSVVILVVSLLRNVDIGVVLLLKRIWPYLCYLIMLYLHMYTSLRQFFTLHSSLTGRLLPVVWLRKSRVSVIYRIGLIYPCLN